MRIPGHGGDIGKPDPSMPLDQDDFPDVRRLIVWLHDREKDEWMSWVVGDFADCIEEYFAFRMGQYSWADEIRIGARRESS